MAYVNDPNQGSGLLGRVFTALGQGAPDIRRGTLIQDAELPYRNLFGDYNKLLGAQTAGLSDFTKSYQALTPQLSALDQLHSSVYGDLVNRAKNYDPSANLRSSGDYLFGNLDKYLNRGLQAGTSAMNQALAAGGYGDRSPGGYSALLNANRVTSNLLPAFNNIVSNLTPLSLQQNSDYFRNLGQIPAWMQGQTDALQATPFRALVPSQIQQSQLMGNLSNLNNLTQGEMANSYFYNQPNGWQKLGNVFSGLYGGLNDAMDTVSKAASTYSNLDTSGLGAQMGLGGNAHPTSQNSNSIDLNQILGALGKGGGGGIGGGAGGINISQLLSLLGQFGVGQNAQPNFTGGSNLNTGQYPGESLANMGVTQINTAVPQATGVYSQFGVPGYNPNPYYNSNPYAQYGAFF